MDFTNAVLMVMPRAKHYKKPFPYQVDVLLSLEPLKSIIELSLAGTRRRGHHDGRRDGRDAPAELVLSLDDT